MKKQFHLVGAFDRHNYGDILFPLVHTEFLKSQGHSTDQIHYYAITESNMEDIGGFKTNSVKNLLSKSLTSNDIIVLCGGDILSADWLLMIGHLSSRLNMKLSRIARRLIGIDATNDVARILLGQKNSFPYVISHNNTAAKIFYTAVGGAGFKNGAESKHFKRVAVELKNIESISVRDNEIKNLLSTQGINAKLIPDTALIMSNYFPPSILSKRNWKDKILTANKFNYDHYYSLQGAKRLLETKIDSIVDQIDLVHQKTGLGVMCIPIGRAPDHEDHIPLKEIYEKLLTRNIPCAYQNSEHVLDIMASLAFAKSYIGTSLHGAITTYAFGHNPCALLSNEVKKLKDFLRTWLQPNDFLLLETTEFGKKFIEMTNRGLEISTQSNLSKNKTAVENELLKYSRD